MPDNMIHQSHSRRRFAERCRSVAERNTEHAEAVRDGLITVDDAPYASWYSESGVFNGWNALWQARIDDLHRMNTRLKALSASLRASADPDGDHVSNPGSRGDRAPKLQ